AERQAVIHEGDKNRKISVVFRPPESTERPVPVMTYVFGGVAAVAMGTGAYFGIKGLVEKGDLDHCKPGCSADDVNKVSKDYAFADILLTGGVVSALAALYLYLSRPKAEVPVPKEVARGPAFGAAPAPGGGTARVMLRF